MQPSSIPGDVKLTISDISGRVLRNLKGPNDAGLNRVQWNLRGDPPPRSGPPDFRGGVGPGGTGGFGAFAGAAFEPGVYLVKLSLGGKEYATRVRVEEDVK